MKELSVHVLMHVPYEGPGCILNWLNRNNHTVTFTKFYESIQLPEQSSFDWLIVMGGPMGVFDENTCDWLPAEKKFILDAINADKTVIGICLGAQLIAHVLGARVYANQQKEIGWFKVQPAIKSDEMPFLKDFKAEFQVFHWHGDTFDLPAGSTHLFRSKVCENQAFLYKEKVLGLQFHFEVTQELLNEMVINGKDELIISDSIQSAQEIENQPNYFVDNHQKLFQILDYFAQ